MDTKITLNILDDDVLKDKLGKYIDKGIVIKFKDNGELPGVALVKIKTDYALRDYIGTSNLQVYHYNKSDDQMFDEVANDISLTKDYDLEFYISHNSSFIISNKKVDKKLVSNNKKDLKINEDNFNDGLSTNNDNKSENSLFIYIAYIIGGLAFIGLIVCIIVLVKRKKNNKANINELEKANNKLNRDDEKE